MPSAKEGHKGLDFAAYVHAIDDAGGPFDLIVIDGRAREACLRAAIPHLADNGLIVFDNTRRKRYREAIAAAPVSVQRTDRADPDAPLPRRDQPPPHALSATRCLAPRGGQRRRPS